MKLERINENKIKCILSGSELEAMHINLTELAYGTAKAKELFKDLMYKAKEELGFEADEMPIMIEAIPVKPDSLMLIITKVDDPEEMNSRFSKFAGTDEENIPVFKSNVFYLYCNKSLNAVTDAPESYQLWIEQANTKLNAMDEAIIEVENLDIDANKVADTTTITITQKDGTTKTVEIKDGDKGDSGVCVFTINSSGHLIVESDTTESAQNYFIQNGHLYLRIGE